MKRALLIAGGTVGGLGAVLAITPPQFGASESVSIASGAGVGTAVASPASSSSSPSASATKSSTSKAAATKSASAKPSAAKGSAATTAQATADPAATKTAAAAVATSSANGSFTGPAIFVNYGTVQVKITVSNGKITEAVALQAPSGRNDRWTNMALPILKQQTLAAQSANIQGASGASYTSYGWTKSLQGALAQAGL